MKQVSIPASTIVGGFAETRIVLLCNMVKIHMSFNGHNSIIMI